MEEEFENEIWKDIKGFDGYYISNYGRIKSQKRNKILSVENNCVRLCLKGKIFNVNVKNLIIKYFDFNPPKEKDEIWKDVRGYEGKYKVSNLGRVYGIKTETILLPSDNGHGYITVMLSDKNNIRKQKYIHRLVAEAFIPNPNNLPEVNHKDETHDNNIVDNLEWCDSKYNNNYGSKPKRISKAKINNKKVSKEIIGINIISGNILYFESSKEAFRQGFDHGNINKCCHGKQKYHKGYIWRFLI